MFRIILSLLVLLAATHGRGQETEFHEFTDKKGQTVRAVLLDVGEDRREMKIRREDGAEFETVINELSLDDQQYIKNWLQNRPDKTDYRLDIAIDRKPSGSESSSSGSLKFETKLSHFAIAVTNLSRDTLESAILEYVIVWDERVGISETNDGDVTYSSPREDTPPAVRVHGQEPLEAVPFNREAVHETETVGIDRVSYTGGGVLLEDDPVGVIVRILTSAGIILAEERQGGARIDNLSWEEALELEEAAGGE
ncbi:MAG: hypothetical protein WD342_04185 [Verrucomicrobiales bacterium]